ncbi:VOC family protein [Cellulomonas pakistanensis]|uniref:VOC family protein n=1 Tax=Cellulomonas pakistanensis TaxID=992287 RepID=A0A919PCE4_9CELL|nr:VOC family protein [Cellulomonas pakistanensis]GIG37158.1 VOC family protein [Cellulomonas pakistanensis]
MTLTTTTHLNFRGDARAALEHYRDVFGGELAVVTHGDAGAAEDPAAADQVLWGQVLSDDGFHVMAFDVPASRPWDAGTDAFYVSVRSASGDEITARWERLAAPEAGATVVVPLGPSPWAPLYGMVCDRFGVTWVLDVAVPYGG